MKKLLLCLLCFVAFLGADEMKKLSTFISNFAEVSSPELLRYENLTLFAIDHALINAPKKLEKLENGKMAISQELTKKIINRYFGYDYELKEADFNGFKATYDEKGARFVFNKTSQKPTGKAEAKSVKYDDSVSYTNGNMLHVEGKFNDDDFFAVVYKSKESYSLITLGIASKAKSDFSKIFYDDGYIGTVGAGGDRFAIKFLSVKNSGKNALDASGVIKIANDEIKEFKGKIKIKDFKALCFMSRDTMASYEGLNPGDLLADMSLEGEDFSINGVMHIEYVIKNGIPEVDSEFAVADGWQNSAFTGIFEAKNAKMPLAFGLGRIPRTKGTAWIDVGVGEFIPDEKYKNKGWQSYGDENDQEWYKKEKK